MGTPYIKIAHTAKVRGLKGEVTVHLDCGLPFCLYEGMQLYPVPPNLYGPRTLTCTGARQLDEAGTCALTFQDIDDAEAAQPFEDKLLLAERDAVDEDLLAASRDVIGWRIVDERYGDLGEITEIIETPANEVWVTEGPYGEVLVPVLDEVVVELPEDASAPIRTHVMEGLVDA
ncbi:MAG: 16S rRNA processing protein RimM [Coriobacteriaceae bacterium]|nr:16S rRNA processing protein RimM [Coriobacteriaceae bacterium]